MKEEGVQKEKFVKASHKRWWCRCGEKFEDWGELNEHVRDNHKGSSD